MSSKRYTTLLIAIIIISGIIVGLIITRITDPQQNFYAYLATIISLVVSFIALAVALVTYFSIDSVDKITSMDGNVLTNENYQVATAKLVYDFRDAHDKAAFSRMLIDRLRPVKPIRTIAEYTDELQRIIDHLIWFAYADFSSDPQLRQKRENLKAQLETSLKKFESISNGVQYLLDENYYLIIYVMAYQDDKAKTLTAEQPYHLENIRGRMLVNPVSRTIYLDYYGLQMLHAAQSIIETAGKTEGEPAISDTAHKTVARFSYEYLISLRDRTLPPEDEEKVDICLQESVSNFREALTVCKEDPLWRGYILFNLARASILMDLKSDTCTIEDTTRVLCADAVQERRKVCLLYSDGTSYLSKAFDQEYQSAIRLKDAVDKICNS